MTRAEAAPGRELRRGWIVLAVLAAGVAALVAKLVFFYPPEKVLGWNTPIQYDDFAFAVLDVRPGPPRPGQPAGTVPTIVTLQVLNRAVRVSYTLDRRIALVIDDAGRAFGVSKEGQREHDLSRRGPDFCAGPIPAGSSCQAELVFDLPKDAKNPRLKISHGGPIFDVVDDLVVGPKRIALAKPAER